MGESTVSEVKRIQLSFLQVLFLFAVILIWAVALAGVFKLDLPTENLDNLAGLLFGAASLALFLFSFLVAVLAIFGWQGLGTIVRERVDQAVQGKSKELASRIDEIASLELGRNLLMMSYMLGEQSHTLHQLKPTNEYLLEDAIDHALRAYQRLSESDGRLKFQAQNNLAYYTAVRGLNKDAEEALRHARELLAEASRMGEEDWLLTCCRVMLRYSEDEGERKRAWKLASAIHEESTSPRARQEAGLYLSTGPGVEDWRP